MGILRGKDINKSSVYLTLIILIISAYITGLPLETTIDSAKYASISRNIYESGDLIHLKIQGEPYKDKPPLVFWLGALSFRLFGMSILAFKLSTILFLFLGLFSLYRLGSILYNSQTGAIAALLFATCEGVFLFSMDVHTDLILTSNIIFGTWQLTEFLIKKRWSNFVLGFVGIGLAMISKGALGLAIPLFAIGGYLIIKRDWRTLFSVKWLAGIPILAAILYPTIKGIYDQFGIEGLKFYFWSNNIDRIAGDYSGGRHDYSFFIHTFLYLFMPWSLYAFSKMVIDFMDWKRKRFPLRSLRNSLCYSGIILLALIISISSQQAPHYLLPTLPFAAIITAQFINDIISGKLPPSTYRLMLIFRNLMTIITWFLAILTVTYFFPSGSLKIWIPIAVMLFILVYSQLKLKSIVSQLIIPPLTAIIVFTFALNTVFMPGALKYHGLIQASYAYNSLATDEEKLYTYKNDQYETYFYPKRISELIPDEKLHEMSLEGPCWVITTSEGLNDIESSSNRKIIEKFDFPHKKLSQITFKFLNPKTRESTLSKIYLLKVS